MPIELHTIEKKPTSLGARADDLFEFITGPAGTGKTFSVREKCKNDPTYGELCATTGIAAINLGDANTLNSTLKYFNTDSLANNYYNGKLAYLLRQLRDRKRKLVVDEGSMLSGTQMDYIYDSMIEINEDGSGKYLGMDIIADLCQLPPVNEPPIYTAKCWPIFDAHTTKLTKIWRQDNPEFINAINLVRAGNGLQAVAALQSCGVQFVNSLDEKFVGTTLIPNNKDVDAYNLRQLAKVPGSTIRTMPTRRGKQKKEWDLHIPVQMLFKVGALVMILANDNEDFAYANGDLGEIVKYSTENPETFFVKLQRNDSVIPIRAITRNNLSNDEPDPKDYTSMFFPTVDHLTGSWIMGTLTYLPLRLAYASTIHKSQGLSLDAVQVEGTKQFFGFDSMAYVAISRCKTPQGLRIVGTPQQVANKIHTNKNVRKWI